MIIKEMSSSERPRERLIKQGSEALTNAELLAILLGTGTKNKTAINLAEEILALNPEEGIVHLEKMTTEELSALNGIGQAKSTYLLAAVELGKRIATAPRKQKEKILSPTEVVNLFMERMRYLSKEYFNVLLLDAKGRIITERNITIGDLTSSIVHPREVFRDAIKKSAAAVVFVHNHPSGDPEPSREDIETTKSLCAAGEILGISVLDHIIIGDGDFTSLMTRGII